MTDETEFDPATRRLCPDGSCVGILGRDGQCSECGRAGDPQGGEAGLALAEDALEGVMPAATSVSEGFDPGRKLCDDGACVGVVGDDGKCSVCGRAATG